MGYRIQNRRDTAARWAEINPILLEGEIGYVSDNPNQYKIGDGVSAWNSLPLRGFNGTIAPTLGYNDDAVPSQRVITESFDSQSEKLSELGFYVSNPEYARAYTDAEGRFLWGVKIDGSIEWAKGVPQPIKDYIALVDLENDEEVERINQLVIGLLADVKELTDTYHYVSNPEWACAIVDAEERILMGVKADGSYYIPKRDMYHVESNPEYAKVVVDSEGRVLFGIKTDGSCYIPKGISEGAKNGLLELTSRIAYFEDMFSSVDNPEWIQVATDSDGKILEGIGNDGKKYLPKQELFEKYNDVEGRTELTTDSNGSIISYRDKNGTKHENKQHNNVFSCDKLILNESNATEIKKALQNIGFYAKSITDWSDKKALDIPMPNCSLINISNITEMPTSKTDNLKSILEFWDMNGNYFKKKVILNAQGSSSMAFEKKNFGADFCNDDWIGDDSFELRIGDWVVQDSFHFKAYYTDYFRGICACSYKLYNQIVESRGVLSDRQWKRGLVDMNGVRTVTDGTDELKDLSLRMDNGARCFPDGFPVMVYLNGEFYGIFSWQLKKHRDNYHLDKKNALNIHLDGLLSDQTIWKNSIAWSEFEVRNPKDLYSQNGKEYDGENPSEIMDDSSSYYDSTNADHVRSATVKSTIIKLSNYRSEIQTMIDNGDSEDNIRKAIEQRFDVQEMIDYLCFSLPSSNYDGFHKNWQWFTYDGVKWFVGVYDCDSIFGAISTGNFIMPETMSFVNNDYKLSSSIYQGPAWFVTKFYMQELKDRYKELRDKGILSTENVISIVNDWMLRIGFDNYKKEYDRWPNSPCNGDSVVTDGWMMVDTWDEYHNVSDYSRTTTYNKGDRCRLAFRVWEATKTVTDVYPFVKLAHRDNIYRLKKWIDARFRLVDEYLGYNI